MPVPPVSVTVWSGSEFVTVISPVVTSREMPVPAVSDETPAPPVYAVVCTVVSGKIIPKWSTSVPVDAEESHARSVVPANESR